MVSLSALLGVVPLRWHDQCQPPWGKGGRGRDIRQRTHLWSLFSWEELPFKPSPVSTLGHCPWAASFCHCRCH